MENDYRITEPGPAAEHTQAIAEQLKRVEARGQEIRKNEDAPKNVLFNKETQAFLLSERDALSRQLQAYSVHTDVKNEVGFLDETFADDADGSADFIKLMEQEQQLLRKDKLTNLDNRRAFFDIGVETMERLESGDPTDAPQTLSVMSLDIDFFKAYNDVSHTFGDVGLQTVAKAIHAFVATSQHKGIGVRQGGEEIFLVMQEQMTAQEIKDAAETLRGNIQSALRDLFATYDTKKNATGLRPDMTTQEFLEEQVLTTDRGRNGIVDEFSNRPDAYQTFLKTVEPEISGIDVSDMQTAPDVLLAVKKAIKNPATGETRRQQLQQAIKHMGFELGGVTVGVVHVDCAQPEVNAIKFADAQELIANLEPLGITLGQIIPDLAAINHAENTILHHHTLAQALSKMPYRALVNALESASQQPAYESLAHDLKKIVNQLQMNRFGRIVDTANKIGEEQKKRSRNSVFGKALTLRQIDHGDEVPLNEQLLVRERAMKAVVAARVAQNTVLLPDALSRAFEKDVAQDAIIDPEKLGKTVRDIQQKRYRDQLTGLYNYDYVTTLLPDKAKQLYDAGYDLAVVSYDVDNLKAVNESGSHLMGDWMLMTLNESVQQSLEKIMHDAEGPLARVVEKIKKTGMDPEVMRATGGEEFMMVFPGLSSGEARQITMAVQDTVKALLKKQFAEDFPEETEKIRTFLGKQQAVGKGLDEFASFTAGIVSLTEVMRDKPAEVFKDGTINVGMLRQEADAVGEALKKQQYADGSTGRGHTWDYETYQLVQRVDFLERGLREEIHENAELHQQIVALVAALTEARKALTTEKEQARINALKAQIKTGLGD